MARTILIAECATAHGGDLRVAEAMITAAADAGCDYVKFQSYSLDKLNRSDPQRDWLVQSHLDRDAHKRLQDVCGTKGIQMLSTPFDDRALEMLQFLWIPYKIASSEQGRKWWTQVEDCTGPFAVSYPWGLNAPDSAAHHMLTAIPLYPTPSECVAAAAILDGWSDHCEGLWACQRALARGATILEAHLTIPGARRKPWDKSADDFRVLREWADQMETLNQGVSQQFRDRWTR